MIRQVVPYTTEAAWLAERARDLTSTSIPALFGESPYMTRFELYHQHASGLRSEYEGTERTIWGQRLEPSIARGIAHDEGWHVEPFKSYQRLPEHRVGSSFDFVGTDYTSGDTFLVEVKNVDGLAFRDGWLATDYGLEAPAHIEIQAQVEMGVSEIHRSKIVALVGGDRAIVLDRVFDPLVFDSILAEARVFWTEVDWLIEPPADFYADLPTLSRLYGYAEPDKVMNATPDIERLLAEYEQFSTQAKIADEHKQARKAELLTLIGDAEKVLAPGGSLSAGMIAPTRVEAFDKKGYRNFRYSPKRKPK